MWDEQRGERLRKRCEQREEGAECAHRNRPRASLMSLKSSHLFIAALLYSGTHSYFSRVHVLLDMLHVLSGAKHFQHPCSACGGEEQVIVDLRSAVLNSELG